jgi:hypothetical protein
MTKPIPFRDRTLEVWVRQILSQKDCADVEAAMLRIKTANPDTDWSCHEASCAAVTKAFLVFEIGRQVAIV